MSYAAKGEKVFSYQDPTYPNCTPPGVKRSDHRLKRFQSNMDKRAWSFCEEVRHKHFHELISGSRTCIGIDPCHKYVPLEDLIKILMAEKDALINALQQQGGTDEKDASKKQLAELTEEVNKSREMLRKAMHKLQNIDEIVNENKKLQCRLRCSEERVKYLEEKKKNLEAEVADLRSKSQIQIDLEAAQQMLCQVTREREEAAGMGEAVLQCLALERDELQEKVKQLEKELEESKKKEAEIEILRKQSHSDTLDREEMSRENECYRKKLASMKCLEKQIQDLKKQGRALVDKHKKEAKKTSEQMSKMCQAAKELQALREERDSLRKRVGELSSYECQYKKLQRKLQRVDAVIAENEKLNCKLLALEKLEKENEYLRCRLEAIQEVEMNAAEDKERIMQLQCAVADQEEEMKDLLCQIERLTNGRNEEELERLRCELCEKNSKLKLCEEQLAEIPMLEAEIDELRMKLQCCCREFPEKKKGENSYQRIEVRFPATSTGIRANYKTSGEKCSSVIGIRREERIDLKDKPKSCQEMLPSDCRKAYKVTLDSQKKDGMSCEEVRNLLQSSKRIISCVLEDMLEHQKEMEELETCNRAMKEEIETLKARIGGGGNECLLQEINQLKSVLESKNAEIARLKCGGGARDDEDIETIKELNRQMKAELEAACIGLKQIAALEKMLEEEHAARCAAEMRLGGAGPREVAEGTAEPAVRPTEEDPEFDCCKSLQRETDDLKLQIEALNKLTEELKRENELLRELQQPCPDFSKELDEKCALENLLSMLQAELDAFKGQKLSDECEALRTELKRVMEQNCQLKALVDCYRQRLDLEKKSNELNQMNLGVGAGGPGVGVVEGTSGARAGGTGQDAAKIEPSPGDLKPDAGVIGQDAEKTGPGAGGTGQDAREKGPDAGEKGPDAGAKGPNAREMDAVVAEKKLYVEEIGLGAGGTGEDAAKKEPDIKVKGPGTVQTGTDTGAKGPDAGAKGPDVGAKGPDVGAKGPDVGAKAPDAKEKGPGAGGTQAVTTEAKQSPSTRVVPSELPKAGKPEDPSSAGRAVTAEPKVDTSGCEDELKALQAKLSALKQENDNLKSSLAEAENKLNLVGQPGELEKDLMKQIEQLKKEAGGASTGAAENEKADCLKELEQLRKEKDDLANKLQAAIKEAEKAAEKGGTDPAPQGGGAKGGADAVAESAGTKGGADPAALAAAEKEKADCQKELDKLRKENDDLGKQLNEAKTAAAAAARPVAEAVGPVAETGAGKPGFDDMDERLRRLEAENAEKLKKLMEQHEKELADKDKRHNDNLNAMKSGYETDIRKLAERHKQSILRLQELHEDEVQEMNVNYETQLETMQTQSEAAINDIATGSAARARKLAEAHSKDMKDAEAKFHDALDEKEDEYLQALGGLQNNLTKSMQELAALKKKEKKGDNVDQLKAQHAREMQKARRTSKQMLNVAKAKMEEERKKSAAEIESLKEQLKEQAKTQAVCECKYSKKKPPKVRDPSCPLDFNEVLEKILEEGLDSLTFNEIALVHRKTCCALEGIVMNSVAGTLLEMEPPVGDGCPHTPLLEADKQQLLSKIFALENDIIQKQKETQEVIISMEVAIKKERCRLLEVRNSLQNEQQKNLELKSLLTSQTKLHSNLKKERDRLGNQASMHQSLCQEKSKQLDEEMRSKKCLEVEVQRLRNSLKHMSMTLYAERGNSDYKHGDDQIEMMRKKLEQSVHEERRLALQLENETKCRFQLQCQLQTLRQSLKHMVNLPSVESIDRCSQNPLEAKSAKERRNLDQINEKGNKIKTKPPKKHKK